MLAIFPRLHRDQHGTPLTLPPAQPTIQNHDYAGNRWGTYKRGCMMALCRAFNWAVKARKIPFNSIN
jgi:hypothetical protein